MTSSMQDIPASETSRAGMFSKSQISLANNYRDAIGLTRWFKVVAGISIVDSLVNSAFILLVLSSRLSRDSELISVHDNVSIALFVIYLLTFFSWVHRANYNARELGANGMRFSPRWSVGWFFMPIANFWKPYQVLKEIWQASSDPAHWQKQYGGRIVRWWWCLYLLQWFIAISFTAFLFYSESVEQVSSNLTPSDVLTIALDVSGIVSTCIVIAMLGKIYRMQSGYAFKLTFS
jgi:Domain of unknown function (DUF4328)